MSLSSKSQLGKPFVQAAAALSDSGLPNFITETKKRSKHYQVSNRYYLVKVLPTGGVVCAKQVYSDSVNNVLRDLYGDEYVVEHNRE